MWLFFHGKKWLAFLLIPFWFVPLVNLVIALHFGGRGRWIAWNHGNYSSIEELEEKERGWDIAGVMAFVLVLIIGTLAIVNVLSQY